MDDLLGKVLRDWIAADLKAVAAERRVTESSGEAARGLTQEAERLRSLALDAREKVAQLFLNEQAAVGRGETG